MDQPQNPKYPVGSQVRATSERRVVTSTFSCCEYRHKGKHSGKDNINLLVGIEIIAELSQVFKNLKFGEIASGIWDKCKLNKLATNALPSGK